MNAGMTQLDTLSTSVETGNYAYSDLSIDRFPGGYVFAYVWPTTGNDKLSYRIKTDVAGEGGAFNYGLQTWSGGLSRSGFSVAYNYRTGRFRFVWKEN